MDESILKTGDKKNFLEKISFGLLTILVFLLPIFFMPVSFTSVQFGSSLLFAFLTIASALIYVISRLKAGKITLPLPKPTILTLFFSVPLVYILSFLTHGAKRIAFLGYTFDLSTVGFVILGFIFMFLVSVVFNNKEKIFYAFIASVISSIVVALFILLRLIFGPTFLSFGIFNSVIDTVVGSFNNTGIFFGISVLLSLISLEMLNLTKFMRRVLTVALILSIFFLMIINFKLLWVVLAIVTLVFTGFSFYNNRSKHGLTGHKSISKYSLAVLVISVIFVLFHSQLGSFISSKLNIFSVDVRPNFSATYDIAKQTLKNDYILGSGPNSFVFQWLSYKPSDINSSIFWNTDFSYGVGLIPTFIITTGFLGLVSWFLFFISYLFLGFKSLFDRSKEGFDFYIALSAFLVSLFLWVMAIVYVPSVVVIVLTFFFTGLFLAEIFINNEKMVTTIDFQDNPKKGFIGSLILVGSIVALVGLGLSLYANQLALWNFQKSLVAANSGDIVKAESLIDKAIEKVPYDVYYRTKSDIGSLKIQKILSTPLTKDNQEQLRNDFINELSRTIQSAVVAKDNNQNNYLNWVSLAKAYSIGVPQNTKIEGAYEEAVKSFSEAINRNPNNPAIYLLLSQMESSKGDNQKAKEYINMAISKKANYLDAYYLLSQIQVSEKNIKEAIKSVSQATIIDPSNPALFFQLGVLKYNNGDFRGALESLSQSVLLAPDYANAKYFMGLSYAQLKDTAKALEVFRDILKTNTDNAELKKIISNLEDGNSPFSEPATSKDKLPVKEDE